MIAVVAVRVGVRAGICMIAVPTPMRSVTAATQVMVVTASEPYASADHTEWKPSRSASCTIGTSILSAEPE